MKLDRLLAITMMLINNDIVTAKDLADKFEVSIRTIYRDLEILGTAGIPVISYQGVNGGFGIMEGFKIEKGLLNNHDIESISAILKGMSSIFDDKSYDYTLDKIKTFSLTKDKTNLIMDFKTRDNEDNIKKILKLIREGIESKKVISFTYTNTSGEKLSRSVEPLTLVLKYNNWYLYAFCRNKNDYRIFKVSRIRDLILTEEICNVSRDKIDELNFDINLDKKINFNLVELKFNPKVSAKALDAFRKGEISYSEDGYLIIKEICPEVEGFFNRILSFGREVEIIAPPHLRSIIKQKAKEIFDMY